MKILLTATTILLMQLCCAGQEYTTLYSMGHKVSSTTAADMQTGNSRNCFNLHIPPNTDNIIISISTSLKEVPPAMNAAAQLADMQLPGSTAVQNLAAAISGAGTAATIHLYGFAGHGCADAFVNHARRQCQPVLVAENITGGNYHLQGPVMNAIKGRYISLCIGNAEHITATYYHIEVIAISSQTSTLPTYNELLQQFGK